MTIIETIPPRNPHYTSKPFISVVIPVRDLEWVRLANCIKSIYLQNRPNPSDCIEVIIADYGSSEEKLSEMLKMIEPYNCVVYRCSPEHAPLWSLSIARNIGIRRAKASYIMTLDADIILEQNVFLATMEILNKQHRTLLISRVRNLHQINLQEINLPMDYDKLSENCFPMRPGCGGLMCAHRHLWYNLRGFDERMKGWGAEDDDFRGRAAKHGWVQKDLQNHVFEKGKTKVFHQHHVRPWLVASEQITAEQHSELAIENKRIFKQSASIKRNDEKWGMYV